METGDSETPRTTRIEITDSQGVQVGDHNEQTNIVQYIQTYIEHVTVQFPSAAVPDHIVYGNVPQVPPAFQRRDGLLSAVSPARADVSLVHVITGMRGVGKTQIAAECARQCIDEGWQLVAWIDARDHAAVLNGLGELARRLGLETPDAHSQSAVRGKARNHLEAAGGRVRNYLESIVGRCLLVFDDVTDVDGLRPFLPSAGNSRVLVTSIVAGAGSLGVPLQVGEFSEAEALSFLRARTGRDDAAGASDLARELGYLPLALAHAAAVVASDGLSYQEYLRLLSASPMAGLERRVGEPYPRGVAESIQLSVDAVATNDQTGLCRDLLDMVSLLSSIEISRSFAYAAAAAGVFVGLDKRDPAADQKVSKALGLLADASLLTFGRDGSTMTAHPVVMRVCRERLVGDGTILLLGARICALLADITGALAEPEGHRTAAKNTIRQVLALHEHLAPCLTEADAGLARALLAERSWALSAVGGATEDVEQGIAIAEPLVIDQERLLGEKHPDTLTSRHRLATAYVFAGREEEAVPLLERVAKDRKRVLGKKHQDTLDSQAFLAAAYVQTGQGGKALLSTERLLGTSLRTLRKESVTALRVRFNLGAVLVLAGQAGKGVPLMERATAEFERLLGPGHRQTLLARGNLAGAYIYAGREKEAALLLDQALSEVEQLEEPIRLLELSVTWSERRFGKTHFAAEICRRHLANARGAADADTSGKANPVDIKTALSDEACVKQGKNRRWRWIRPR